MIFEFFLNRLLLFFVHRVLNDLEVSAIDVNDYKSKLCFRNSLFNCSIPLSSLSNLNFYFYNKIKRFIELIKSFPMC
jgi:hypothetical protein